VDASLSPTGARRRLAALAALGAVVAMAVVAVVALFGEPSGLVLALALLAIAAGAAWLAVTNRGVWRVLAMAAVLAAVVAIALVLGGGTGGILALVAIAALLGGFGAAARYAVGPPARPGTAVGPARQGALIVNPWSGGGKVERFHLVDEAEQRGIRTIALTRGSDLRSLAEDAVAEGADVLGMAGGDGSQAIVASVAARHGLPHVAIPAGTRNHFALDLGLDRDDVIGALDAYGHAEEHVIDLATVNDRVFVNNASLGAYAQVVQSDAYRDAKLRTWADMAPDVLDAGGGNAPRFRGADHAARDDAAVILVSNNAYHLTSVAGAGTRARLDAGTLGIATVRIRGARDAAALTALEATGRLGSFRGLAQWNTPAFQVDADEAVPVGVDGEALVLDPPLRFEALPGALRVRIPGHAPGSSPARRAVRLTGANLARLWRLALGREAEA
jgi:diacylglycerol kinase family enzyme